MNIFNCFKTISGAWKLYRSSMDPNQKRYWNLIIQQFGEVDEAMKENKFQNPQNEPSQSIIYYSNKEDSIHG